MYQRNTFGWYRNRAQNSRRPERNLFANWNKATNLLNQPAASIHG